MSNDIITEQQTVSQAALNATQRRNRRLLIAALAAGCACCGFDVATATYLVNSKSQVGRFYHVGRIRDETGKLVEESCDCQWGTERGPFHKGTGALPCSHVLVMRWELMSVDSRDALLEMDTELAAVAGYEERAA